MFLQKKVSRIFKFSVSSGFDRSGLFFDRLKREEENSVFKLKVSGLLDSFLTPFDQSSLFLWTFRSLPDSSRPIGFRIFKTYRNQIRFLNYSLSFSPIPLSIPSHNFFFFFIIFLGQRFKGFLQKLKVRHFCPFLFIKLLDLMHFLKNFPTFRNLGFLMFLGILIKTKSWVFLHASFKHGCTLISEFSWFVKSFAIMVLKFLRDLEILWNWEKLNKIGLYYW